MILYLLWSQRVFVPLQFKCELSLLEDSVQNFALSESFLAGPFWATQNSSFLMPYLSATYSLVVIQVP